MTRHAVLAMFVLAIGAERAAAADPERLIVLAPNAPDVWEAAESAISSTNHNGKTVLRWNVDVDHTAGESNYPIGWPRIVASVPDSMTDWQAWDFVEFRLKARSSRPALPSDPAGLILFHRDGHRVLTRPLTEVRLNEWVPYRLVTADLPEADRIGRMQFYISERDYGHGDRFELLVGGVVLTRRTSPTVIDVVPEAGVFFADAGRLAVRVRLTGLPTGGHAPVACTLTRNEAVIASTEAAAGKGWTNMILDLPEALHPGACLLRVSIAGDEDIHETALQAVDSPWR